MIDKLDEHFTVGDSHTQTTAKGIKNGLLCAGEINGHLFEIKSNFSSSDAVGLCGYRDCGGFIHSRIIYSVICKRDYFAIALKVTHLSFECCDRSARYGNGERRQLCAKSQFQ